MILEPFILKAIQLKQLLLPEGFGLDGFYANELQMTLGNIVHFGQLVRLPLPSY